MCFCGRFLALRERALPSFRAGMQATLADLADKARALVTQNDPNAVRAGLADIADALATMSVDLSADG